MTLFLSAALVVACAALIWALGAFDRLIEVGSAELDDRLIGGRRLVTGQVRGARESFFQNGVARNRLFLKRLFQTPKWASERRLFAAGAFLGI
jgi:hypothetical protein